MRMALDMCLYLYMYETFFLVIHSTLPFEPWEISNYT